MHMVHRLNTQTCEIKPLKTVGSLEKRLAHFNFCTIYIKRSVILQRKRLELWDWEKLAGWNNFFASTRTWTWSPESMWKEERKVKEPSVMPTYNSSSDGDKWVPEAHWPASLASMTNAWPMCSADEGWHPRSSPGLHIHKIKSIDPIEKSN